jgi:hypothetical protein
MKNSSQLAAVVVDVSMVNYFFNRKRSISSWALEPASNKLSGVR